MEFLLRDFETQPFYQESIQLSFFLHGRGTILQKNRLGMYRSLLHQLLRNAPDAQAEFRRALHEKLSSQGEPGKDWDWHANELRAIFMSTVELVAEFQPINIFVDALDEASDSINDKNTSHQIVSDFHQLNDLLYRKKFRSTICFSCRHFPVVADNQGQDICVEEENHADISAYVCDELRRRLFIKEAEKAYLVDMQNTISRGAQGVFQWASLVVSIAVQYHHDGFSPEEIKRILAAVPEELSEVYEHILGKVNKKYFQQTLRLLRWVYLAERPLTVTELCFAMSLPDREVTFPECFFSELELPTPHVMIRRIVSLSGGLVESKPHERGQIIQFIHQSVNDFLLQGGLQFLDKTSPGDAIGQGHNQLSLICANYIRITEMDSLNNLDNKSLKAQLPFVDYAVRSWFLHAEKAETRGLPQDYLLRYSQHCPDLLKPWIKCYRILVNGYDQSGRQPEQSSTMLHIASGANLVSVVEGLLSMHFDLEQVDGSLNRPLHYASRWGHTKIVKALLDAGAIFEAENNSKCTALERAAANGHENIVGLLLYKGADVNKQTGRTGNALCGAAAKGSRAIVQVLLDHKAEVNAQGGVYGNALQAAAYQGSQAVVQLLLDQGADINAHGGRFGNALQAAAYKGHQVVVQLLLDQGAEINTQGGVYGNALQAAAATYKGDQVIIQLLLDQGADINAQGGQFGNALQAAAYRGYQVVVQLLLDQGADINTQGGEFGNALQAASYQGYQVVVQLLLDQGADVNAQGGGYSSALQAAAYQGHQAVIQLLLDQGAAVNAQGGEYSSALQAAAYQGHQAVVQLLLDQGADINAQGGEYGSALQAAAYQGHQALVQLLLDQGADINAQGGVSYSSRLRQTLNIFIPTLLRAISWKDLALRKSKSYYLAMGLGLRLFILT
jgi:ankyrin repeat protein